MMTAVPKDKCAIQSAFNRPCIISSTNGKNDGSFFFCVLAKSPMLIHSNKEKFFMAKLRRVSITSANPNIENDQSESKMMKYETLYVSSSDCSSKRLAWHSSLSIGKTYWIPGLHSEEVSGFKVLVPCDDQTGVCGDGGNPLEEELQGSSSNGLVELHIPLEDPPLYPGAQHMDRVVYEVAPYGLLHVLELEESTDKPKEKLFMHFNMCSDTRVGISKGARLKLWNVHRVHLWGVEDGYVACVHSSICVKSSFTSDVDDQTYYFPLPSDNVVSQMSQMTMAWQYQFRCAMYKKFGLVDKQNITKNETVKFKELEQWVMTLLGIGNSKLCRNMLSEFVSHDGSSSLACSAVMWEVNNGTSCSTEEDSSEYGEDQWTEKTKEATATWNWPNVDRVNHSSSSSHGAACLGHLKCPTVRDVLKKVTEAMTRVCTDDVYSGDETSKLSTHMSIIRHTKEEGADELLVGWLKSNQLSSEIVSSPRLWLCDRTQRMELLLLTQRHVPSSSGTLSSSLHCPLTMNEINQLHPAFIRECLYPTTISGGVNGEEISSTMQQYSLEELVNGCVGITSYNIITEVPVNSGKIQAEASRHYIVANIEGVRHFSTQPLFYKAVQGGAVRMGDFSVASQYMNHDTRVLVEEDLPKVPPIMSVHEVLDITSTHVPMDNVAARTTATGVNVQKFKWPELISVKGLLLGVNLSPHPQLKLKLNCSGGNAQELQMCLEVKDEITEDRVLAYLNLGPEGAKWPLGLVPGSAVVKLSGFQRRLSQNKRHIYLVTRTYGNNGKKSSSIEVMELRNPAPPSGVLYSFAPTTHYLSVMQGQRVTKIVLPSPLHSSSSIDKHFVSSSFQSFENSGVNRSSRRLFITVLEVIKAMVYWREGQAVWETQVLVDDHTGQVVMYADRKEAINLLKIPSCDVIEIEASARRLSIVYVVGKDPDVPLENTRRTPQENRGIDIFKKAVRKCETSGTRFIVHCVEVSTCTSASRMHVLRSSIDIRGSKGFTLCVFPRRLQALCIEQFDIIVEGFACAARLKCRLDHM
eukprot:713_1